MVQLALIKNEKLKKLIGNSASIQGLPEEEMRTMIERMEQLSPEGQEDMAAILDKQQADHLENQKALSEEEKKNQIKKMEAMTIKVMGATRRLDKFVLEENEAASNQKNRPEDLLKNI